MSVEGAIEGNTSLESNRAGLFREIHEVKELVAAGVWRVFTPDRFPELDRIDPDLLATYKSEAIVNRLSMLSGGLKAVSGDAEARQRFADEMSSLYSELSSIEFSDKDVEIRENQGRTSFWMGNGEREGLAAAIRFGAEDAITSGNFPGLSSLDRELVDEMRAEANQNRIDRLTVLLERMKARECGFGQNLSEDPVRDHLMERITQLRSRQTELLSPSER